MSMRVLFVTALVLALVPWARPAAADDWDVKSRGDPGVFIQRYQRLLESRLKMDFNFKRLLQLYEPKGGAEQLIAHYQAKAKGDPRSAAYQTLLGHLHRHVGRMEAALK